MQSVSVPIDITDPVNARILAVSEDRIAGFLVDPITEIATQSGVDVDTVVERLRAMLAAGTIRRIRQTLMATSLAPGALVAWKIDPEKLDAGFDYLFREDPFSGHVVLRSTDGATPGAAYRLWTTLKVPQGFSIEKHCEVLRKRIGAEAFKAMPAKCLFALGVGHVRRKGIEPGSRSDEPGRVIDTTLAELTQAEWGVLEALKRELSVEEVRVDPWESRAEEAGMTLEVFSRVAKALSD